jgi:indole-3-glycerol phosphate synthase
MRPALDAILADVRGALAARKAVAPYRVVADGAARNRTRREIRRFLANGPGIIAEIKRASPSRGWIRRDLDAGLAALRYVRAGACGVSVLTEKRHFGGSLADLARASAFAGLVPVLRKDFILDEYMLAESRACGADLVLLIAAVLGEETPRMVRLAAAYGLEALVEVHDEEEMAIARRSGATIIGINNRNLSTLAVDLSISERLLPLVPSGAVAVVESGISRASEVRRFAALGARALLVGESIVAACDPEKVIGELTGRRTDGAADRET